MTGDGDIYYGGPGDETLRCTGPPPGRVRVSLVTGRGQLIGQRRADILINVDGVYGSRYDDVLIGDSGANHLYGDVGNDTIHGLNGGDIVCGGDGDDTLDGGLPDATEPWPVGDLVEGNNDTDTCIGGETPASTCEATVN